MLRDRIFTATILLTFFLGALFFLSGLWWSIALLPLLVFGAVEWANICMLSRLEKSLYCLLMILPAIAMIFWNLEGMHFFLYILSGFFWLTFVPIWLYYRWHFRNKLFMLIVGFLLILPTWSAFVMLRFFDSFLLLSVLGVIWTADIAAYFIGRRWGVHKLAKKISPGKTWEGFIGAVIVVVLYLALLKQFAFLKNSPYVDQFYLLMLCLAPMSVLGDLFESLMKRQAGIKDSGSLLPGHGGVLDRIDALTSTLPLAALFCMIPWYFDLPKVM